MPKASPGAHAWLLLLTVLAPAGEAAPGGTTSPALPEIRARDRWQFSADGGATWAGEPPPVPGGKVGTILARAHIDVPDPAAGAFWQLTHALPPRMDMTFALNGREVPAPLKAMYYRTIGAIPAKMLGKGKNELTARIRIDNRPPRNDRTRRMPAFTFAAPKAPPVLAGQRLRFQTGPVLGAFDDDFFTVTCRTSIPAAVKLSVAPAEGADLRTQSDSPIQQTSPTGLHHRFRVPRAGADPAAAFTYKLTAAGGGQRAETDAYPVRLAAVGRGQRRQGPLRFVIMGDSRTNRDDWSEVAAAVLKEKPHFVVFTGDMCERGTNDWEWDEHYFAPRPARRLLATVPFYTVKGNHEENAPLYAELFYTPSPGGKAENWAQQLGSVLLIGIDGQWSPRWQRTYSWVEKTLAESKAEFIFLVSHYPAWSSAGNGKLDPRSGRPTHWAYRTGRNVIVPMLVKHRATAFVVAHEHHYERSELPGGLMQIISGGAGAPRSGRSPQAARQNPHSRVFAETLNYCLFEVDGDTCTFKAKTPDGRVIDTLAWHARKLTPATAP